MGSVFPNFSCTSFVFISKGTLGFSARPTNSSPCTSLAIFAKLDCHSFSLLLSRAISKTACAYRLTDVVTGIYTKPFSSSFSSSSYLRRRADDALPLFTCFFQMRLDFLFVARGLLPDFFDLLHALLYLSLPLIEHLNYWFVCN